jgi:hypothetical protein
LKKVSAQEEPVYYTWEQVLRHPSFADAVIAAKDFSFITANALSLLPADIVDEALANCLFIQIDPQKTDGRYLHGEDVKGKSLLLLFTSDYAVEHAPLLYYWVILHEFAHYRLNHRQFRSTPDKVREVIEYTEKEANTLTFQWLSQYVDNFPSKKPVIDQLIENVRRKGVI